MGERPKLIRLPDGMWVRPDKIDRIVTLPPLSGVGGNHLPRVVVWVGQSAHIQNFPGMDEARAFADELAAKVNDA